MAAAAWHLIKTFIREATEDEDLQPVDDIATAYAKLRAIQRGHFTTVTDPDGATAGLIQVSSQIKDTAFSFAVPASLGTADIIAIAEQAIEMIEGKTVAEARALLKRRKTTRPDFRGLAL